VKSKVAIVKSGEDPSKAVEEAIKLLGGVREFIEPGETVLLKPNLFTTKTYDTGATTDMRLVVAFSELLRKQDCHSIVGECPATSSYTRPDIVFNGLGVRALCEEYGIELRVLDRDHPVKVDVEGRVLKEFWYPETAIKYPVVNFPKLKTHSLTTLTCAVKNLFGLQQGGTKAHHHVRVGNDAEAFSELLVDLYQGIMKNVKLHVVDAVIAMEGEGPTSGEPVNLGLIIVGTDAVAVDIVCSAVMGWDPMDVGTNYLAGKRGLGPSSLNEIEVVGEQIDAVSRRFRKPEIHQDGEMFIKIRMPILCDEEKCKKCGVCAKVCPVGAIEMKGIPEFHDDICIQCFCCVELCPHKALKAIRPPDE
jgi:uncharacterized protein (DUF362 family)/NAD-dependent dihydropyrimidine dehydrogenase PreA subunit